MKIKKLLIIILLFISIFVISCKKDEIHDYDLDIITTYNGEAIPSFYIHTALQDKYLTGDYKLATVYGKGDQELSKPNPIVIDFSGVVRASSNYEFYLDLNDDMENKVVYNLTEPRIELKNLRIKTVYYYQIKTESELSNIYAFLVNDDIIRNIDVDGVTNVRDLGGYKVNGKRINQGLLYRSSKFNEDESTTPVITDDGIDTFINELKIKTEIDLRKTEDNEFGGITSSPLGAMVKYIHIPMKSGGNCILLNTTTLPTLFSELAKEENYPIVFHCSIGTDRTGMVAFLVLNLLGVNKDDIYYDYLLSNFAPIGRVRLYSTIDDYYKTIEDAGGETPKEQAYNYLLSIGVEKSDLDSFIRIMTK